MNWFLKTVFATLLVSAGLLAVHGCGSTAIPTYSYGGPGSAWTATLNADGTFSLTHAASISADVDLTVTGTYSRLTTGFVKLTVTSSEGTDGPEAGAEAYGLEVPGFAFLLKPIGSDANLIPMVTSGSCPTENLGLNWIVGDKEDATSAANSSSDFFGTFLYTAATGASTLPSRFSLAGSYNELSAGTIDDAQGCSNGIISFTGGAIWLTTLGGALVHLTGSGSSDDSTIIAMPQTSLTDTSSLGGDYAGLVFDKNEGSGDKIYPVSAVGTETSSSVFTVAGTKLTNVETGATAADEVSIVTTGLDSPSAGFMKATITANSSTGAMICTAAKNVVSSGKNMIFCVSQSPGDNTKMFNLLLVSK